jgi:glutathione peroxidase
MTDLYDFEQPTLEGQPKSLGDYRGQVALIVNVASRCGLTPQYRGLEDLYRTFKDQGLVVLGFPCNQFGAQEPGSAEEIRAFCSTKYDVSFPIFKKLDVNGPSRHPLYTWLTSQPTKPEGPGDIGWNFGKFLVGRDGQVRARFAPPTAPNAPDFVAAVEAALAK